MKKKVLKIIVIMLAVLLMFSAVIFSASVEDFNGEIGDATSSKNAIVKIISTILNITRIAGSAVAAGILMVVACKYIIASAGDRADIKKYAINYIIGALILFGASGLVSIAKKFVDATGNNE